MNTKNDNQTVTKYNGSKNLCELSTFEIKS